MHKRIMPAALRANVNYSHGILAGPGQSVLAIAGQVGQDAEGNIPDDLDEQARRAWGNLMTVLHEAGMGPEHLLHYTSFVVAGTDTAFFDAERLRVLGNARPASTKVYVVALARPEIRFEIQAFAAGPALEEPVP